jgi:phage tail-like protein
MESNYLVGFRFELSFQGEDAAFQEVSGISKEMSVEEVVCGGENRFKYRLPTVSSSQNLVLKRGRVPESSKLINWCIFSLDKSLAYKLNPKDVTVSLLDENGDVSVKWLFHNAYPIKYSISDFKSDQNQLLIETIELAYSYFEIPN